MNDLRNVEQIDLRKMHTVSEIAHRYNVTRQAILKAINKGILKGYKFYHRWWIHELDAEKWGERHKEFMNRNLNNG